MVLAMEQAATYDSPWAHKLPLAMQKPPMDPKEQFYRRFQATATALQEQISQLEDFSVVGGERQDAVEHILTGISRLSNEVADASDHVPSYDQRTYSEAIKTLSEQLNKTTSRLAPKTRFQFRPRGANAASSSQNDTRHTLACPEPAVLASLATSASSVSSAELRDSLGHLLSLGKDYNQEMALSAGAGIRKPSFSAEDILISDHTGLHIILPSTASRSASAGSLTELDGCIVDVSAPTSGTASFASLAMKNIKRSLIIAGRVSGPAHITNVRDSIVIVAARQVRIHDCRGVDIYLHCTSHPIIEDCSGMRFAPIPMAYASEKELPGTNQWDQVDDFKWLKAEPSPNWSVLKDEERIPEDTWRNIVPGGPGVSVGDILKTVGIKAY